MENNQFIKSIFFICLWITAAQCNQPSETDSTEHYVQQYPRMTKNEMKFKTAPVTLATVGEQIFLADLHGFFGWSKNFTAPTNIEDSGLSRILAVVTNEKVATIGQWLPTLKTWAADNKEAETEIPVFTGKASAIAAFGNTLWIAGADKDTSNTSHPNKDHVQLLPEKIVKFEPGGKPQQLNIGTIGRLSQLCAGENWLLFTEKDKPESLSFFRNKKLSRLKYPGGLVTAMTSMGGKVLLGSQKGLWQYDPSTQNLDLVLKFNEDEPVPIQLSVVNNKIFFSNSEGVWSAPERQPVGRSGARPYTISPFKDSLLILWPNGELEKWNQAALTLENTVKLPVE